MDIMDRVHNYVDVPIYFVIIRICLHKGNVGTKETFIIPKS